MPDFRAYGKQDNMPSYNDLGHDYPSNYPHKHTMSRYNKLNLKHPTGGGEQAAGLTPMPIKPLLAACRPNPFRNSTQISYALPTAGNVSLRVYDATGRTVRMLASGFQRAGSYSVSWDSRDDRGRQVPRGVYFYRLDAPGFRSVKKAVVTR